MEFVLGGVAACGACLFTNPLEVVKTRMQLQGELQAKGLYKVHYKNVFHAFYAVARNDGIAALQKGLVPALWYQLMMNGVRLGVYQTIVNSGFTKTATGDVAAFRSVLAGALAGCCGACVGSPFYMLKTQLQAQAAATIAVGFQHKHSSMRGAFSKIYKEFGVVGLWRGVTAAIARVTVGSGCQLATFSKSKEVINNFNVFAPESIMSALFASMLSGVAVVLVMTPFDVVSTRLYNQGCDPISGKGMFYSGVVDCFQKVFAKEGLWGFYKGWSASFLRLGPHTVLSLVFWDKIRGLYYAVKSPPPPPEKPQLLMPDYSKAPRIERPPPPVDVEEDTKESFGRPRW